MQPSGVVTRGILPRPPVLQTGFLVSSREWNRIKQLVKAIRSEESHLLSSTYALMSAGIAFGISAASNLWQLGNAGNWIFISFCALAAAGLMSAIVCFFAFKGSKGQRQRDVESVIAYMDDIEANYTDEPTERQSTP